MLCYICGILFLIILLSSWNASKIKNKLAKNLFQRRRKVEKSGGSRFYDIRGGSRGGQTKVPIRKLRAKPESRVRSARVSRAKPESRARSARELRAKPEPRAKPEKKRGEGSGEGARWAPPQKIFEKSNLKPFILVHIWSNYLKWLTKWFNCHFNEKSLVIISCDGKSDGRSLGEPVPRKFVKNKTWNHSFWGIFEAIIWND